MCGEGVTSLIAPTSRPVAVRERIAVSRPEPESLLLTVGKLKKLVGEENVGVPMMLDQRLAEAFKLDPDAMPDVTTDKNGVSPRPSRNALRRGSASPADSA